MRLDKIKTAFWTCVACRVNVKVHQNNHIKNLQSNFQRENKKIVFGVPEKNKRYNGNSIGQNNSHKKSDEEFALKVGIPTSNNEHIFCLGNLSLKQIRPRPQVVKLTNTWNDRIMMSNSKVKANNIFIKNNL